MGWKIFECSGVWDGWHILHENVKARTEAEAKRKMRKRVKSGRVASIRIISERPVLTGTRWTIPTRKSWSTQ